MNKEAPPLLLALDLEMNQPSGRIIQIGAVVGDRLTGKVVSHFAVLTHPGEPLEQRIAKLCGIRPQELETAGSLEEGFAAFERWLQPFDEQRTLNPLTWGGGDTLELCRQLGHGQRHFGRRWLDVKTVFTAYQMARGEVGFGGLARALTKVGLRFEGRKHNAADDAKNTFYMWHRLSQLWATRALPSDTANG